VRNEAVATPEQTARDPAVPASGLGGPFTARERRFTELRIGSFAMANLGLLTDWVPEPAYDLILGLDVLGRRRFRLSYVIPSLALI